MCRLLQHNIHTPHTNIWFFITILAHIFISIIKMNQYITLYTGYVRCNQVWKGCTWIKERIVEPENEKVRIKILALLPIFYDKKPKCNLWQMPLGSLVSILCQRYNSINQLYEHIYFIYTRRWNVHPIKHNFYVHYDSACAYV